MNIDSVRRLCVPEVVTGGLLNFHRCYSPDESAHENPNHDNCFPFLKGFLSRKSPREIENRMIAKCSPLMIQNDRKKKYKMIQKDSKSHVLKKIQNHIFAK